MKTIITMLAVSGLFSASVVAESLATELAPDASGSQAAPWGVDAAQGWLMASASNGLLWQQDKQLRTLVEGHFEQLAVHGDLALTIDVISDQVQPVALSKGKATKLSPLPLRDFQVQWLCLQPRAADNGLYAWLGSEDGRAEQWLLQMDGQWQPQMVRTLSLPPEAAGCAVDAVAETLYVADPSLGVWAYPASPFAPFERELALASEDGITGVAVSPQGQLLALTESGRVLSKAGDIGAGFSGGEMEALAVSTSTMVAYDDEHDRYRLSPFSPLKLDAKQGDVIPEVPAWVESDIADRPGDTMDDPAIWVHPTQPELSRVIGTNKRWGLLSFDMQGNQLQGLAVGKVNNVDLRQGVMLGGKLRDIGVASNRDVDGLTLFEVSAEGEMTLLPPQPTTLKEIYGLCLAQPGKDRLQVFANDKSGRVEQLDLVWDGTGLKAEPLGEFSVPSQPEGCVVDDKAQRLFLGEEDQGIWVFDLSSGVAKDGKLIANIGGTNGEFLHDDVEGLALYHGDEPYLVVSSQGNDSYLLYQAEPPYAYQGRFRIGINAKLGIDGSAETDGLAVTSKAVGSGPWAKGMVVVQDGRNRLPDAYHNFKWVPWQAVLQTLKD
ncbi:phytase [Ferrimonas aestuarii]|uniref:Phytase n=1 Tax=Ferrimonas aestuarii TaxID=2569539 RepID=A0A4U1BJY4_9GAMM|nr:phytase [Ferrimonas aestuarii]TKB51780.1 phytase [Ferrimonas aestuarii]